MKRFSLIVVSSLLAVALLFGSLLINHANTAHAATVQKNEGIVIQQSMLSPQKLQFLKKLQESGLLNDFTVENGHLAVTSPLSVLQAEYQLSASETQMLQSMLLFDQERSVGTTPLTESPLISLEGTVIYFTFDDLSVFLLTAASAGSYAMAAALVAVASLIGGPVGTFIGGFLSLIGIASLANFCYLVDQAGSQGKGVYIGIQWNWFYPNYVQGEW